MGKGEVSLGDAGGAVCYLGRWCASYANALSVPIRDFENEDTGQPLSAFKVPMP